MAVLNFPSSPTVGQIYTANGRTFEWDGVSWNNKTGLIASSNSGVSGFKNKVIGGNFTTNPWQRGTSRSFSIGQSGYLADMFSISNSTASGVFTVSRVTDSPTTTQAGIYSLFCLDCEVTTAVTNIPSSGFAAIIHRIEGFNISPFGFGQSNSNSATLSFWHKHTKIGTYSVAFSNSNNSRNYIAEYTQDVSDTWEKAVITIPVDTTGTWFQTNSIGLAIWFNMATGSTYQTSSINQWVSTISIASNNQVNSLDTIGNKFKLSLVQLELGTEATEFEQRSYGEETLLCYRYYYREKIDGSANPYSGSGYVVNLSTARLVTKFPVEMRARPTSLEQSGTAGDWQIAHPSGTVALSSVPTYNNASRFGAVTNLTVASGLTTGQGIYLQNTSATETYLGWSASL